MVQVYIYSEESEFEGESAASHVAKAEHKLHQTFSYLDSSYGSFGGEYDRSWFTERPQYNPDFDSNGDSITTQFEEYLDQEGLLEGNLGDDGIPDGAIGYVHLLLTDSISRGGLTSGYAWDREATSLSQYNSAATPSHEVLHALIDGQMEEVKRLTGDYPGTTDEHKLGGTKYASGSNPHVYKAYEDDVVGYVETPLWDDDARGGECENPDYDPSYRASGSVPDGVDGTIGGETTYPTSCTGDAVGFSDILQYTDPENDHLEGVDAQTEDEGCFITTATARDTHTLNSLRRFRDESMSRTIVGQSLVDLYYKISPPIAETLSENPDSRTANVTRGIVNRCASLSDAQKETDSKVVSVSISMILTLLYMLGIVIAGVGHTMLSGKEGESK